MPLSEMLAVWARSIGYWRGTPGNV
jgi:hypothetical protein